MATGGIFKIISSEASYCDNCTHKKAFNKKFTIDLSKYKCICEHPTNNIKYDDPYTYIIDVQYGCLQCMSKCIHKRKFYRSCPRRYHCYDDYIEMVNDVSNAIHKHEKRFGLDYTFDILMHTKHILHYDLLDARFCFNSTLNIHQIRMLLDYEWIPSYNFLKPYFQRSHLKTVIEIRNTLIYKSSVMPYKPSRGSADWWSWMCKKNKWYEDKIRKNMKNMVYRINRAIRQYNTMRTNLYIMMRAGLLYDDVARCIEEYIL